jgi:hypothetical protein
VRAGFTFAHLTLGQEVLFQTAQTVGHLAAEVKRLSALNMMVTASAGNGPTRKA